MSLPPNPNDYLESARQVIANEAAAVLSARESVDQNFADVVQTLLSLAFCEKTI